MYWGKSPNHSPTSNDCTKDDGTHDTKCAKRVPETKKCDIENVPDATGEHECILWSRINGTETCHYRKNGVEKPNGCKKETPFNAWIDHGINSEQIEQHIDAACKLSQDSLIDLRWQGHRIGMAASDPDFAGQKERLQHLYPNQTINDHDAIAEINLFHPDDWNDGDLPAGYDYETLAGFYVHRYGWSHYDNLEETKENDQCRRINTTFDWHMRHPWCAKRVELKRCNRRDRRNRYTLTHEAAHDITESHLKDKWHHPRRRIINKYIKKTEGVLEAHAPLIEEHAGKNRRRLFQDTVA